VKLALALVLAACSKHDDKPAPAPPPSGPTETIALPLGSGEPIGTATTFLRYANGGFVEISPASIFGERSVPFHGLDPSGTLSAATGAGFTPPGAHEPFPVTSPTAIFVDRTTSATALRTAVETLRGRCWGFAVADRGKLELAEPATCPPAPRTSDQVNLDLFVTTAGKAAAHLSTGASTAFADLAELAAYLATAKATPAFSGRTDLAIAFDDQATVATLVDALGRAHAAGFTSAAWVAAASDELRALTR
jgi:hypothetical protein